MSRLLSGGMGTLLYGSKIQATIDDASLIHLDVLIARLKQTPFQLHFMPNGADDGNLVSLSIGPGVHLALMYLNTPDIRIDLTVIDQAEMSIRNDSFVTIPFAFESDLGKIDGI